MDILINMINGEEVEAHQKIKNEAINIDKVVLARLLATDCDIILFDEPTCGIDVGAKPERSQPSTSCFAKNRKSIALA